MKKEVFIKLLRLANQGMFLYKDKLYQQHDGVSMGSPLAPTLANFFLAHIENKLLGKQLDFHPKLYSRYVDDIFAVFDNSDHCTKFLDLLNSQHNNIKFTVELPSDTIPFLDVEIRLNETGIDTWVYRKPTNTNLILNFNALCPTKWKSGLILCFLNRAKRICSSDFLFDKEVSMLKKMFLNNGYPSSFFDKILASFQSSSKFSQNISFENSFCIPYLGKKSHHFANRLSALIKNKYNLKISPIYKTFKVVNYFQLKSKTPVALCSNVVYKFSCSCDTNKTYIGMSSRHLITRVREHLNFKSLQDSAVKDHILSCEKCSNNRSDENNFVIIRKCKSEFCSKIHEALLIKKLSPKLNRQMFANGASYLLNIF